MFFDKSDKVTNVNYNPCCSTSAKYSAPGNHGTRLMLVNEVALGNIKVGEIRFAFAFLKLRTVPTIVIAHTFCASPDTRISNRQCLLIQG